MIVGELLNRSLAPTRRLNKCSLVSLRRYAVHCCAVFPLTHDRSLDGDNKQVSKSHPVESGDAHGAIPAVKPGVGVGTKTLSVKYARAAVAAQKAAGFSAGTAGSKTRKAKIGGGLALCFSLAICSENY